MTQECLGPQVSEELIPAPQINTDQSLQPDPDSLQQPAVVPAGTVYTGEYTPERRAAIRRALERGMQYEVSEDVRNRIVELYRSEHTRLQIAREVDPEYAQNYPSQAGVAVGYVVGQHIPHEERRNIQSKRAHDTLGETLGGYGSEQHRIHQKEAARAKYNQGISVNTDAMTRGRGLTPWTGEEKELVKQLMIHGQEYRLANGKPNFDLIATILNTTYHDNQQVRTAKNVYDIVRYEKRRQKKR